MARVQGNTIKHTQHILLRAYAQPCVSTVTLCYRRFLESGPCVHVQVGSGGGGGGHRDCWPSHANKLHVPLQLLVPLSAVT